MNPIESPEISVEALLALRKQADAVRLITERLKVKEMCPSYHIRTKHEVKQFVESGDAKIAELLLKRAGERRTENLSIKQNISVRRGQSIGQ